MRDRADHPPLPEQFRSFGRSAGRDGCALYDVLCQASADDPGVLGLLDVTPDDQRRPNLLLAAVHFLLLGGDDHPLGRRYATVAWTRGDGPAGPADAGAVAEFADFCRTRAGQLAPLLARRATQTNETGRCAALLPGLGATHAVHRRPLGLIDLGTSAGLNLHFDRYRYRYHPEDGPPLGAGAEDSPVTLECRLRGDGRPPLGPVPVPWRHGVDLDPVDPADGEGARWLLACLWPHDVPRFERLGAALAVAAADPVPVARGDLLAALPELVAAVPEGVRPCLFHSWVAAYLTTEQQGDLAETVERLGRERPLTWLYAESPYEVPALGTPPAPGGHHDNVATVLVMTDAGPDGCRAIRLADLHHHGAWLTWW